MVTTKEDAKKATEMERGSPWEWRLALQLLLQVKGALLKYHTNIK